MPSHPPPMRGSVAAIALTLAVAAGAPATTRAQTTRAQTTRDSAHVGAREHPLLRHRNALTLGAFALGGVVAYHNDGGIAREFQRPQLQDNRALRDVATVFRNTGQPGVLVGGVAAYTLGRMTHRPVLATAGLHVTEAIVVTGALTVAAKYVAGRARPFVSAGQDPRDFELGRGRAEGYTSMPSGHTSAAFATASALAVEWRAASPRSARFAVPLLYTGATMVGLSRIYNDKHWASDVVAGATLGTLTGGVVARWGHRHPGNRVERWLVPVTVAPAPGGGVHIGVSRVVR